MPIRCPECDYDRNTLNHRFCGMCGAPLESSTPLLAPTSSDTIGISLSGPSFLGLAEPAYRPNNSREDEWEGELCEEEYKPTAWRTFLVVILLIAVGLMVASRWRGDDSWRALRKLAAVFRMSTNSAPPDTGSRGAAVAPASTALPENNLPSKAQTAELAQQPSSSPDAKSGIATGVLPSESQQPGPLAEMHGPDGSSASSSLEPSEKAPTRSPAEKQEAQAEQPPAPATNATRGAAQDKMISDGEKYLYGNSLPQSCDQARARLFAAAQKSNPEAQSVLGTMFATGHCVARDLPTAYRWFVRAERKQPNNPRIEEDLRLLWREMSAEEQRVAVARSR
jgi:hypothetical protein